ncbi:LOW QUALITY PROTEIN: rhomboid domain-containing protein 2 [Aulostomus maculatus]
MSRTHHFNMILDVFKELIPVITSGILMVVVLSCALFGVQTFFSFSQGILSVGASVFVNGHLHRLFMYPFYHRTVAQLLPNIIALVLLGGSLEKGVGTVRFLFLFFLLSTITGFFYAFLDLMLESGIQAEGLLPVALACVAFTTMHTKMTKGFLCGVSFPTVALPWLFVVATAVLIPHAVLPCNIIATLMGWMHGKGWFSLLDISETQAASLEKMLPFRLLRSFRVGRRKTLLPQINPTPGSYPVQAYAPVTSVNTGNTKMHEGWLNSAGSASSHSPHSHGLCSGTHHEHFPVQQSFSQSCNHSHLAHL